MSPVPIPISRSVATVFFACTAAHAACTGPIATATAVSFGSYLASSPSDVTANGSVVVSCSLVLESLPPFTISLSRGLSSSYVTRTLAFGGSALGYNLYTTPSFTTIWGDGTSGTQSVAYSAGGRSTTLTVYGRLPSRQFVTPGVYTDNVTVTVTY